MKLHTIIAAATLSFATGLATAQTQFHIQELFHGDKVFDGLITFSTDYAHVTSITGTLSSPHSIPSMLDITGIYPGYYKDYSTGVRGVIVMGSGGDFDAAYRLDLVWDYNHGAAITLPQFVTQTDPDSGAVYYANSINGSDGALSYTIKAVPEPAAYAMLLGGLALLAARRRLAA